MQNIMNMVKEGGAFNSPPPPKDVRGLKHLGSYRVTAY